MFHDRCEAMLADYRKRLDTATQHILDLEADLRLVNAKLVDALRPTPQSQVTESVLEEMVMPEPIAKAIRQVAGENMALARHLDGWARSEIDRGAMISEIARQILHGDDEEPAPRETASPDFLVTTAEEPLPDDEHIEMTVGVL